MAGDESHPRWMDNPIIVGVLVAVIASIFTGAASWMIAYGRIQEMITNNTALINRVYIDYKDDLAAERRTTDAYINGILPRIENLERKGPSAQWSPSEQFRYALWQVAEAVVPVVPPPASDHVRLFDKTVTRFETELRAALKRKAFSEMSEEEKDDIRTLTVKLNLARAWRVWCSQSETNETYCRNRFGEP